MSNQLIESVSETQTEQDITAAKEKEAAAQEEEIIRGMFEAIILSESTKRTRELIKDQEE